MAGGGEGVILLQKNQVMAAKKTKNGSVISVKGEDACRPGGVCVNMRPDGTGGVVAVGRPVELGALAALADAIGHFGLNRTGSDLDMASLTPLCEADDGAVVCAVGRRICVACGGAVTDVGDAGGDVYCGVCSGGAVTVMTSRGPGRLTRDASGEWRWLGVMPHWPELHFSARDIGTVSGRIAAFGFRRNVDRRTAQRLPYDDEATLGARMAAAYRELDGEAIACRAMVQPVLMRYKLRDSAGRLLHVSAPVMVGPDDGWQCTGMLRIRVKAGGEELQGFYDATVEGRCWRPEVLLPAVPAGASASERAWMAEVAEAEITVTAPVHPVYGRTPLYRLHDEGNATAWIDTFMPGTAHGMATDTRNASRRLLRLGSMMEGHEVTLARIADPFTSVARRVEMERPVAERVWRMWPEEVTEAVRSWRAVPQSREAALCSAPHSMAARCVAAGGSTAVWADITPLPWHGAGLGALSVGDAPAQGVARAWTRVAIAVEPGREMLLTRVDEAPAGASLALSGFVYYPDARARSIAVVVQDGRGRVYSRRVDLTPCASGCGAAWMSHDGRPVELTEQDEGVWTVPGEVAVECRSPSAALIAPSADVLAPVSGAVAGEGSIVAVTPAHGAHAGWDFGCGRYYLMTTAGIFAFTAGHALDSARCSMIDPRGCGPAAVATPAGVWVVAAGAVVCVSGTRAADAGRLWTSAPVAAIGWEPRRGELWIVEQGGRTVVALPASGLCYERSDVKPASLLSAPGHLYVAEGLKLLDASRELASDDVAVEWCVRVARDRIRVSGVEWRISSDAMEGWLDVAAPSGARMLRLSVNGLVRRPLRAAVVAPQRTGVRLRITGAVAAASAIEEVGISRL